MTQTATVNENSNDLRISPLITMTMRDLLGTIGTGLGIGILTSGIYFLMNRFVFAAVLCRSGSDSDCINAPLYAMIVAMVFGAIAGLVALAALRIYRPLLIVIATSIVMWGFSSLVSTMPWYFVILIPAVLFALLYGLFAWVARIRSFVVALLVTVVLVVLLRFIFVS